MSIKNDDVIKLQEEAIATAKNNLDKISKITSEMHENGVSNSDNPAFNNFMKNYDALASLTVKLTDDYNSYLQNN